MGTHAVTRIHEMKSLDENEKVICQFFRHFDGYPTEHGNDIAECMEGKTVTNGYCGNVDKTKVMNRMGTFATHLSWHIHTKASAEMEETGSEHSYCDYTYDIYYRDDKFVIAVDGKEYPLDEWDAEKAEGVEEE